MNDGPDGETAVSAIFMPLSTPKLVCPSKFPALLTAVPSIIPLQTIDLLSG